MWRVCRWKEFKQVGRRGFYCRLIDRDLYRIELFEIDTSLWFRSRRAGARSVSAPAACARSSKHCRTGAPFAVLPPALVQGEP
jgi:hypothetical protein